MNFFWQTLGKLLIFPLEQQDIRGSFQAFAHLLPLWDIFKYESPFIHKF